MLLLAAAVPADCLFHCAHRGKSAAANDGLACLPTPCAAIFTVCVNDLVQDDADLVVVEASVNRLGGLHLCALMTTPTPPHTCLQGVSHAQQIVPLPAGLPC